MSRDRLYLLDAHALCYRSFYAIRNLSTSKGQATNAVFGYVNAIRKILRVYKPEYMAVCFDSPKKTYRQEKYTEYKIQRPKMPDDLISQIPIIKEVTQAFNLSIFEFGGFEADDIIATLCQQAIKNDLDVVIISDDKDMYQLANEKVKFLSSKEDRILTYQDIKEKLGFEPRKIVDFISLAGDQTDNIPGVFGVGEVTAEKLIQEFGSLEEILKDIDKVKPDKTREKIMRSKDNAILSKELAILEANVPFNLNLEQLKVDLPDRQRLLELFQSLEFKKFAQELIEDEPISEEKSDYREIEKLSDAKDFIELVKEKNKFSFLLDMKEDEEKKELKGLFISTGEGKDVYIKSKLLKDIWPIFEDENIVKITFNVKEVLKDLSDSGFLGKIHASCLSDQNEDGTVYTIKNKVEKSSIKHILEREFVSSNTFDVMLAAYLLSPGKTSYTLSDLIWERFNKTFLGNNPQETLGYLIKLYPILLEELKKKSLLKLFEDVEIPLAYILFGIERDGIKIDIKLLNDLAVSCDKKIEDLQAAMHKIAGTEINLNSPKQLGNILFEKLKLPVIKKTKTGFSTDEDVLKKLAKMHEFPSLILEYRQLSKLKSTYIDALPKLADKNTHRIHASFNQAQTETGRLSSSNPNLQNIPIRTELGRQIRKAFIPTSKDMIILAADYSQIELRILAHLSGDKNLIQAFIDGQDVHKHTASLIYDVAEDLVAKEMRNFAKRINFGIIYGMSAFGLAKDLEISNKEAQEFIEKYFIRYPKVKEFMEKCIKDCEENGFVATILNRRRYIPEINNKNNTVKQFAQRQAINTPVQGSAADLIKLAMISVQREIEKSELKSKMIITVHDELVFEVPLDEKEAMIKLLRDKMENAFKLTVPIAVTIKCGNNWLDLEGI